MLNITKGERWLFIFNVLYIGGFAAYYVLIRNYEFLWYVAVMLFFFGLLLYTLRRVEFSLPLLWGLSLWGLFHMAGGGIMVNGDVLYAYVILPLIERGELLLLRYDQLIHAYGFAMSTLVMRHLILRYMSPARRGLTFYLVLVLSGTGMGVLNEIVEFVAVLAFTETGVGGYTNTALDLVFNTMGATVASIGAYLWERKQKGQPLSVLNSKAA